MLQDREVITVKKVTICKKRFFFMKSLKSKTKKEAATNFVLLSQSKKILGNSKTKSRTQKWKEELFDFLSVCLIVSQCVFERIGSVTA